MPIAGLAEGAGGPQDVVLEAEEGQVLPGRRGAERSAADLRLVAPEGVAMEVSEVGGAALERGGGPVEAFASEQVGQA